MPDKFKSEYGFTLAEAMVVVALVAVLSGLAVPSFTSAIQNSRMTSHYNSLSASLTLARSEAIKRAANVSVCAIGSATTCGNDWSKGWIVFSDEEATPGTVEGGETVIKRVAIDDAKLVLSNEARLSANTTNAGERSFISFGPRGTSNWQGAGFFLLCDDRGTEAARLANITLSGDVRKGRRDASDNLVNAWGAFQSC